MQNLPFSVFVGQWYVQHGEPEWRESRYARYPTYLVSVNHDLPEASAFAHGDSIHAGSGADTLSVKKVDGNEKADIDRKNSEKQSSKGTD